MQAIMWVILMGTVGLASLLDYHLEHLREVFFGDQISDGPLQFQLPAGWAVSRQANGSGVVYEAANATDGRVLRVIRRPIPRMMSPVEYLLDVAQLSAAPPESRDIHGWTWQELAWGAVAPNANPQNGPQNDPPGAASQVGPQTIAYCLILPTRQAVTVSLDNPHGLDRTDVRLIAQTMDKLSIIGIDPPTSAAFELPGGISVQLPADFQAYPELDELVTERTVFSQTSGRDWATIQLIPVFVPSQRPAETMRQALSAREFDLTKPRLAGEWLNANITQEATEKWRIEPLDQTVVQRRAYLLGEPGKSGLLVEISGAAFQPSASGFVDDVWGELAPTISLKSSGDLPTLLSAGSAALSRSAPSAGPAGETWWLWSQSKSAAFVADAPSTEGSRTSMGWSYVYVDSSGHTPLRVTARKNPDKTVTRIEQRWEIGTRDLATMIRRDGPQSGASFVPTLISQTDVENNITTLLTFPDKTGRKTIASIPSVSPIPRPFVLSADFPQVLDALSDTPLALYSDQFPGSEGNVYAGPILLLVKPVDRTVVKHPGLHAIEVEVNGTGRLSRWWLREDGSVDHADFDGGITFQPSSAPAVKALFGDDPRMAP